MTRRGESSTRMTRRDLNWVPREQFAKVLNKVKQHFTLTRKDNAPAPQQRMQRPALSQRPPVSQSATSQAPKCFGCGNRGHTITTCPNREGKTVGAIGTWNDEVSAVGAGVSSSSADAYTEEMLQSAPMVGATVAADEEDIDLDEFYESYSEDEHF